MPCPANCVDPDQLASEEANWSGSTLFFFFFFFFFFFSFSIWLFINNLDQVIRLAENQKWLWHLNLFSMTGVRTFRKCYNQRSQSTFERKSERLGTNSSDTEAPFWIWIYVYLMVQFPPKFMINGTILTLIQSISLFWMVMSPGVPHMGYTYLNLLDSPELLQLLVTLTA